MKLEEALKNFVRDCDAKELGSIIDQLTAFEFEASKLWIEIRPEIMKIIKGGEPKNET